ncbi:MAG: 3-deoxy-manno-octulosonate cytidylyltransferase [Betaproteobacteria bacterium]|nr:3-deoxy-manno-octulosonate cytidylyltransferase [Betaproteobacteria bacterium]
MVPFIVIIPARYASTRLPAKPLADIHGKPMVVRVADRARLSGAASVWIACDDERIVAAAAAHDAPCLITAGHHASGTDRLAEAADRLGVTDDTIVVNVQGDEPLIDPAAIREVAHLLAHNPQSDMATLCHPIHDQDSQNNPNQVKVVLDQSGHALYFSRAPIPWPRDGWEAALQQHDPLPIFRHVGLYAYRAGALRRFCALPPAPLEQIEALEQLRALWHGWRIRVGISETPVAPGVDTAEDLAIARRQFAVLNELSNHNES